jgi:hypothetical protein
MSTNMEKTANIAPDEEGEKLKDQSHSVYMLFLIFIGLLALISLAIKGWSYYLTPLDGRPFHEQYATMKPSGSYSHGLGIIGATMITIGVTTYSSRKRLRRFRDVGRLSYWLEFHIFLCLVGPILVVYHTTFKAGGIAAISLWTMLSVVASGVIGRFLYVQIPRNAAGADLSLQEITAEIDRLASTLLSSPLGVSLIRMIDSAFETIRRPKTLVETVKTFMILEKIKSATRQKIRELIRKSNVSDETARQLRATATARAGLMQKSLVLGQVERLFYYWHVIHLPFSLIMFVTLAAHVTVSIILGYHWIF